jgi:hypothetical protein
MPEISAFSLEASVVTAPGSTPGVSPGGDLIPLRAGFGQDEASHGAARYSVDKDGLIQVPPEAVGPLTTIGGFVLAQDRDNMVSAGEFTLHHDDAAGCSYVGRRFFVDANGNVLVPAEAASELSAHGFVPVYEETMVTLRRAKSPPSNPPKKV